MKWYKSIPLIHRVGVDGTDGSCCLVDSRENGAGGTGKHGR